MDTTIKLFPAQSAGRKNLDIRSGDTARVWIKIQEKGKTRLQAFEGLVIARKHGREPGGTFTVRKISYGEGVERVFPLYSPSIESIELVRRGSVRRGKLYYLRGRSGKSARIAERERDTRDTEKTEAPESAKAAPEKKAATA